jgi:hypothetical protein
LKMLRNGFVCSVFREFYMFFEQGLFLRRICASGGAPLANILINIVETTRPKLDVPRYL